MKTIYIISGLGVDERVFQKIDWGGHEVIHLPWIEPFPAESLRSYALRMGERISSPNAIICGISFGGMLAVEILNAGLAAFGILLATSKTKSELPIYKTIGKLKIHHTFKDSWLSSNKRMLGWLFGVQSEEEAQLLKEIVDDIDPKFMVWALDAIIEWDNERIPDHYVHLHGDQDRVIFLKNVQATHTILGGGHFMTLHRSNEVSEIIRACLNELND